MPVDRKSEGMSRRSSDATFGEEMVMDEEKREERRQLYTNLSQSAETRSTGCKETYLWLLLKEGSIFNDLLEDRVVFGAFCDQGIHLRRL